MEGDAYPQAAAGPSALSEAMARLDSVLGTMVENQSKIRGRVDNLLNKNITTADVPHDLTAQKARRGGSILVGQLQEFADRAQDVINDQASLLRDLEL